MGYVPRPRPIRRSPGRPAARPPRTQGGAPTTSAGGLVTVNRGWTPTAPPNAYETFGIQPYWRQASCAEVECRPHTDGWVTAVDEGTDLGRRQADYIRHAAGRHYTEARTDAGWTAFTFPPGQQCFGADRHRVPWERPELYIVRPGDHRAIGRARVYDRADQWADDLHTRTDRLYTARSRAGTADY